VKAHPAAKAAARSQKAKNPKTKVSSKKQAKHIVRKSTTKTHRTATTG
jgi:hypothetical protein